MKCSSCSKKQVISGYCKDHFIEYFEKTVKDTIKNYKLLNKKNKVVVAVSGGKDSLTVLYLLKKFGYNIEGLAIDEGINNYREKTLKDLEIFSTEHKTKINVKSFEKEFKVSLDKAVKKLKKNPCHICGVFRRYLLNKYAKKYDVIATGHNLDDECQAVLMNIFKSQPEISARLGPISGAKTSKKFTPRIKLLYFLKDKEVKAYTLLKNFKISYTMCPYTFDSFRNQVQEQLNEYEAKQTGAKIKFINSFLKQLPKLKGKFRIPGRIDSCLTCGEASMQKICSSCQIIEKLKIKARYK